MTVSCHDQAEFRLGVLGARARDWCEAPWAIRIMALPLLLLGPEREHREPRNESVEVSDYCCY